MTSELLANDKLDTRHNSDKLNETTKESGIFLTVARLKTNDYYGEEGLLATDERQVRLKGQEQNMKDKKEK